MVWKAYILFPNEAQCPTSSEQVVLHDSGLLRGRALSCVWFWPRVPQARPQGCQMPYRQNVMTLTYPLPGQMGMEPEIKVVPFFFCNRYLKSFSRQGSELNSKYKPDKMCLPCFI